MSDAERRYSMRVRRATVKRQQPAAPPKTPAISKAGKVWKWGRVAFKIWFWTFTTVAFMLFICEESTQLLGFSRMHYKSIGTMEALEEWLKAVERDLPIVEGMQTTCDYTFIINPISAKVFRKYFDQEKEKLRREVWIANKLIAQKEGKLEAKQEKEKEGAKLEASFQTVAANPNIVPNEKPINMSFQFVYATKSGGLYHTPICYHLYKDGKPRSGIRQYTKQAAQAAGLRSCARCKRG